MRTEDQQPLTQTQAFKTGVTISLATGLYGVSFGALSMTSGLSFWQTVVLSVFLFSGASQFAFIGVIAAGGSGVSGFGASALLGLRNAVYGMQMNTLVRPHGAWRFLAAQVTIDETAAVASAQGNSRDRKIAFWTAGLGIWIFWVLCSVAGALLGSLLGDPKAWGLDGASVAAFLGLLWPRLVSRDAAALAALCAAVTVIAVPFVPSGIPIILAAMTAIIAGIFATRKRAGA